MLHVRWWRGGGDTTTKEISLHQMKYADSERELGERLKQGCRGLLDGPPTVDIVKKRKEGGGKSGEKRPTPRELKDERREGTSLQP